MPYLFLFFLITPMVELWLILKVGSLVGAGPTLGLIVLTAVIGLILLRQQGFATLFRARQKINAGELPAAEMAEALMLACAGVLMLIPGFATDTLGFALLVSGIRKMLSKKIIGKLRFSASTTQQYGAEFNRDDIIDGEFRREPEQQYETLAGYGDKKK